jgi:hypothetical protein
MRNAWILLLTALFAACGGTGGSTVGLPVGTGGTGGGGGPGGGSTSSLAQLRIWVTDAPFPYSFVQSASVVIREVTVHERDRDRWDVAFSGESEIDLVPLTNGVETLLVDVDLAPGTYDEVRMIVDAGEVVLSPEAVTEGGNHVYNTANGRLFFPSGSQTGIKVKVENEIVVNTQLSSDLVLDFDLSRNFVFNGPATHPPGVKRVLFTPVVRAINASVAGSVEVTVLSDNVTPGDTSDDFPIEGATVRVLDADANVVATGSSDAQGVAVISVPPGTYDLELEASGHTSKTVTGADVTLANLTNLGSVTLVASGEIGGVVMSDGGTPSDDTDDVVVPDATLELRATGESGSPLDTTTSDASGLWRFGGLDAGGYDIAVSADGFEDGALTDIAAALETPGYTVLLAALPQDLTGTVTVPDGTDVTTVSVVVRNRAGVTVATASPASDGTYSAALVTGDYEVEFDDGATTKTLDVTMLGASPKPGAKVLDVTFE